MELEPCRALRQSGHYAQAVANLEQLLSQRQHDPGVRFELAETLMMQGYYRRSLDFLDKYPVAETEQVCRTIYLLRMLRCCVACLVEGKFHENVRRADLLYRAWRDDAQSEVAVRENVGTASAST